MNEIIEDVSDQEQVNLNLVPIGISDDRKSIQMSLESSVKLLETMVEFKELCMMYSCAIKEMRTKFEVLDTEYNIRYKRNPINYIDSRLKSTKSIITKMRKYDMPFSIENIEKQVRDIAGVRVVCSYTDDIYRLADALLVQDDITLLAKKDYIQNPKPNGYRSLHLIVQVPVFFADRKKLMTVEVQIRTIAMDYWASLEHQLKYKKNINNQEEIERELKVCADTLTHTDEKMLEIRKQLESYEEETSPMYELIEKVGKLDRPFK